MIGTEDQVVEPTSTPAVGSTKRPPLWGWIVLVLLVVGAVGYALTREPVLLEDDFSTPEVLRTWPYGDAHFEYEDGRYHVTVVSADTPISAVHELPRAAEGMSMTVTMSAVWGEPLAVLECSTEVRVEDDSGSATTQGYVFVLDPADGAFAIADTGGEVLDEGTLAPASQASVLCATDGTTTTLSLQVPGRDAVAMEVPGGAAFRGIALGAMTESDPAVVAYDDLRIEETD